MNSDRTPMTRPLARRVTIKGERDHSGFTAWSSGLQEAEREIKSARVRIYKRGSCVELKQPRGRAAHGGSMTP